LRHRAYACQEARRKIRLTNGKGGNRSRLFSGTQSQSLNAGQNLECPLKSEDFANSSRKESNRWLGRESEGEPIQIATEGTDLSAELQRGPSYTRKAGWTASQEKKAAQSYSLTPSFVTFIKVSVNHSTKRHA